MLTSAWVSFFIISQIFCVSYRHKYWWFENEERAQEFATKLYEEEFFFYTNENLIELIKIQKFNV